MLGKLDIFLKRTEPEIESITGEERDTASFMKMMRLFNEAWMKHYFYNLFTSYFVLTLHRAPQIVFQTLYVILHISSCVLQIIHFSLCNSYCTIHILTYVTFILQPL